MKINDDRDKDRDDDHLGPDCLISSSLLVESVLQAWLPSVARKQWLGSDNVESYVFCHQVEIRIVVDELEPVLCAEGADEHVYGLSDRHAFGPEESVVGCRFLGNAEANHIEVRKREQEARDFSSFASGSDALDHLAVDEVANADKVLLETQIDLVRDTG